MSLGDRYCHHCGLWPCLCAKLQIPQRQTPEPALTKAQGDRIIEQNDAIIERMRAAHEAFVRIIELLEALVSMKEET